MSNLPIPPKPTPDVHRLLNAIRLQGDPAHISFLELFADPEIIAAVLEEPCCPLQENIDDRATLHTAIDQKIRFWYQLGYDAFWQGVTLPWWSQQSVETSDTAALSRGKRSWINEKSGAITNRDDFERYAWPSFSEIDFYPLEYAARRLPEGMGIMGEISGILEPLMVLMGYETLAVAIYEQPDLVEAIIDQLAAVILPLASAMVEMDHVVALWMGDDMGYRTGPMISPKHLRKYIFPLQKQIATLAHQKGIPFLLHSCGNLEKVMPDLIGDVGIDGKHSFEDVIEPVEQFSARYGSQISVIGGVDIDLLARGTEEQVRERTRQILESCAQSRGYILGSGNSITNYIPPANFLAMLDEGRKFNSFG
jgi:uroporphyrinogen decarboxylase